MPPPTRYHRQTLLPQIGAHGQSLLARGHAVIIGMGALGCAAADLLARAGVGHLTIIDRDVVELTNLQRQTLFTEGDAKDATPKAIAAAKRLSEVNLGIEVRAQVADFSHRNWQSLLPSNQNPPDGKTSFLLLDGSDNYETRYLLNDLSVMLGAPYLYAGVIATRGMAATFIPGGPCLRCIFPDPPAPGTQPTCDTAGVLGPAVTSVAAIQATDAIRLLATGAGVGGILTDFDLWSGHHRRIAVARNPECPCCAARRFEFLESGGDDTTSLCGANTVQVWPRSAHAVVDLPALAARLRPVADVSLSVFMLRASLREGEPRVELSIFADGRALVRGTTKPEVARTLYARYIGS